MATAVAVRGDTVTLPLSCPVCYVDNVPEGDQLILPECGHRFCVWCILTWSAVRSTCPLCKGSFEAALVRRALDGTLLTPGSWQLEPLMLLRRAPWLVDGLRVTAVHTSAASATAEGSTSTTSVAPWYGVESTLTTNPPLDAEQDDAEEAREQAFWEQEAYEAEAQASRFLIGNRRFGASGYIRGERLYGRPARRHRRPGRKFRAMQDT